MVRWQGRCGASANFWNIAIGASKQGISYYNALTGWNAGIWYDAMLFLPGFQGRRWKDCCILSFWKDSARQPLTVDILASQAAPQSCQSTLEDWSEIARPSSPTYQVTIWKCESFVAYDKQLVASRALFGAFDQPLVRAGGVVLVCSANYKNTTLFWNIFKNATPIFQKYHTGDLRTPDAGRISPLTARNTP